MGLADFGGFLVSFASGLLWAAVLLVGGGCWVWWILQICGGVDSRVADLSLRVCLRGWVFTDCELLWW